MLISHTVSLHSFYNHFIPRTGVTFFLGFAAVTLTAASHSPLLMPPRFLGLKSLICLRTQISNTFSALSALTSQVISCRPMPINVTGTFDGSVIVTLFPVLLQCLAHHKSLLNTCRVKVEMNEAGNTGYFYSRSC